MSPATNGKTNSPAAGLKRRSSSTPVSAKKRVKKGSAPKPKPQKPTEKTEKTEKTEDAAPEVLLSKPDGWDGMNQYKSFLLSNERFELHDTIFVNSQEQPEDATKEEDEAVAKTIDDTDNTLWVANVVEVRAQNAWNVWVRIEWFYRPDELPGGRQQYHGKKEVIKSPVQDIISAHTVAGHADVTHWNEMDDSQDGIDGLFWRQTFDPSSGKLSETRTHCICHKPYNPDTTMFWCEKCKIWEHEKCLTDAIRKEYLKSKLASPAASKKPRKSLGKSIIISIATNQTTGEVVATIDDKDRKVKSESEDGADSNVKNEDGFKSSANGEQLTMTAKCLKCGTLLQ